MLFGVPSLPILFHSLLGRFPPQYLFSVHLVRPSPYFRLCFQWTLSETLSHWGSLFPLTDRKLRIKFVSNNVGFHRLSFLLSHFLPNCILGSIQFVKELIKWVPFDSIKFSCKKPNFGILKLFLSSTIPSFNGLNHLTEQIWQSLHPKQ